MVLEDKPYLTVTMPNGNKYVKYKYIRDCNPMDTRGSKMLGFVFWHSPDVSSLVNGKVISPFYYMKKEI